MHTKTYCVQVVATTVVYYMRILLRKQGIDPNNLCDQYPVETCQHFGKRTEWIKLLRRVFIGLAYHSFGDKTFSKVKVTTTTLSCIGADSVESSCLFH